MRCFNTSFLQRLRRDRRGMTTVEYAIVLCLIAAASVKLWSEFGSAVTASVKTSSEKITKYID